MKYARVFKDPQVRQEMLLLRSQGWSLHELAFRYSCEKSSVRKICIRNGLVDIRLLPRPIVVFRPVYFDWNGERLNTGKTYKEYLKEAEERKMHPLLRRKAVH